MKASCHSTHSQKFYPVHLVRDRKTATKQEQTPDFRVSIYRDIIKSTARRIFFPNVAQDDHISHGLMCSTEPRWEKWDIVKNSWQYFPVSVQATASVDAFWYFIVLKRTVLYMVMQSVDKRCQSCGVFNKVESNITRNTNYLPVITKSNLKTMGISEQNGSVFVPNYTFLVNSDGNLNNSIVHINTKGTYNTYLLGGESCIGLKSKIKRSHPKVMTGRAVPSGSCTLSILP